ncbi:hypothetical protein [Pseudonocardia sp. ICBG1293]|uniref:hypothetical protein n=1 Tax=Pseudonocardia sp. ICBG1293 TaxID=2844382 RepID=UPI001CCE176A|nr:hypothetical protein [Pseudonocardia sp. ICBG1293]
MKIGHALRVVGTSAAVVALIQTGIAAVDSLSIEKIGNYPTIHACAEAERTTPDIGICDEQPDGTFTLHIVPK